MIPCPYFLSQSVVEILSGASNAPRNLSAQPGSRFVTESRSVHWNIVRSVWRDLRRPLVELTLGSAMVTRTLNGADGSTRHLSVSTQGQTE